MTQAVRVILDAGVEDYTGLWKLVWYVRDSLHVQEHEARQLAQRSLAELLLADLVRLYQGQTFAGDERRLATQEALKIVGESRRWDPPVADEPQLRIAAAEAGRARYYGEE